MRREMAPQLGWLLIIIVVGFAVVWPVAQLQVRAFAEGGSAFARMPRIGDTIWTTVVLAVASSVLAVVLGTLRRKLNPSLLNRLLQESQFLFEGTR